MGAAVVGAAGLFYVSYPDDPWTGLCNPYRQLAVELSQPRYQGRPYITTAWDAPGLDGFPWPMSADAVRPLP